MIRTAYGGTEQAVHSQLRRLTMALQFLGKDPESEYNGRHGDLTYLR
jgi:hypothetical protein